MSRASRDDPPGEGGWGPSPAPPWGEQPRRPAYAQGFLIGVLVLAIAVGGYVAAAWLGGPAHDESGQVIAAGNASAFDLREGDCFDAPVEAEHVSDVTAVPCSEPHDLEAFVAFALPMGDEAPFPDDETLLSHVDEECLPAFDDFVGAAYEHSELDLVSFEPTPESWADGDREILCAAATMDGSKLEGSVRGSGR